MSQLIKQELDSWLDKVDYTYLNTKYQPTPFALGFINFIKLMVGQEGEGNKTPVYHLRALDALTTKDPWIVNLFHRGAGKALSLESRLPTPTGWTTMGEVKVGDEVIGEDGKPAKVTHKSKLFHKPMYKITLVDGRTLDVSEDHINVVIYKGKRKDIVTSELYSLPVTKKRADGTDTHLMFIPSPKALKLADRALPVDPYTLGVVLGDGHISYDCGYPRVTGAEEDFEHYFKKVPYEWGSIYRDKKSPHIITVGIKGIGAKLKELGVNVHGDCKFIPKEYLRASYNQRMELLRGLLDTDGSVHKHSGVAFFYSNSPSLCRGVKELVLSLGGTSTIKTRKPNSKYSFVVRCSLPDCPVSLPRKVKVWKPQTKTKVAIKSIEKIEDGYCQCIAVDNKNHTYLAEDFIVTHNTTLMPEYLVPYLAVFGDLPGMGDVSGMMYVADSMDNGAKNARNNIQHRMESSDFIKSWIIDAKFTDKELTFTNKNGHKLGLKLYGANTGIRGTKIFGKRPTIAILDDLMTDEVAKSPTALKNIEDVIYKGVIPALDPTRNKVIFNGTPFNKEDPIVKAVESGAWVVNTYPVCERFPCNPEDFKGGWEDRFSYEYVQRIYNSMCLMGKEDAFYGEYMLRLTAGDDRLIPEGCIKWYQRESLLKNRNNFNFYITTDFATSSKKTADFSVISVWAYNANGDWFWVDGVCARQTMDKNINDLFRLVQQYKPQSVGIEVTGQQGAFINWLQNEQLVRNIWFNFASSSKSGDPGIRPATDKLTRLNLVVPWFKAGKMFFPTELKTSTVLGEFMQEIKLATVNGLKGKDDCLDTISMLAYMNPWKPSQEIPTSEDKLGVYWADPIASEESALSSYIV